jgi:tRNA dimethylallyltransferase
MFEAGLLEEMRTLLEQGADPSWNSLNTVGYKELAAYFTSSYPFEEAVQLIKRNTRRFAKRQMTWFRKEKDLHWIPVDEGFSPEALARSIAEAAQSEGSWNFYC